MGRTPAAKKTTRRRTALRIGAGLALVAGLALAANTLPLRSYLQAFLTWVQGIGIWGMVVVAVVYVAATLVFVPGSLLTLGAGYLFGVLWGTIVVSIASTAGAAGAFLIGRFLARDLVRQRIDQYPRLEALDNALEEEAFKVVFLLRLIPVLPFTAMNYAFGLSKISFWRYFLASWIGMLPATVMYVYFGSLAEKVTRLAVSQPRDAVPVWAIGETVRRIAAGDLTGGVVENAFYWLGFVAAVSVTWVVTRKARRELDRLTERTESKGLDEPASASEPSDDGPPELRPNDAHNRQLGAATHPPDWTNPPAEEPYNFVAVGGGTAGLVGSAAAAGLGARAGLVERAYLGGDCLVNGCVPSKGLLRSARAIGEIRRAGEFGVEIDGRIRVDFEAVMERMRRIRADIAEEDSAERFERLGVDVHFGDARFLDGETLEVRGKSLQFERALVATGGRPAVPPIEGLEEAGYLTNERLFSLTELPSRLAVVGGGPIGCEMAQAFQRFGSDVTLIEMTDQLLGREEPEATNLVEEALREDGVEIQLGARATRVRREGGAKVVELEGEEAPAELSVDEILVAVGRRPNVEGLGLEAAGVEFDHREGIRVDDHLRTTNRRVFAAGDVASPYKFTHTADAQARIAVQNALFFGRAAASELVVPWVTYTDPELAHVGLYRSEALEAGYDVDRTKQDLSGVHRALLDGSDEGFLEVLHRAGSDEILGATLVAPRAGDMIGEITLAMNGGLGLSTIAETIHPYPTTAAVMKRAADAYNRTRLKPWMRTILETWFRWRR